MRKTVIRFLIAMLEEFIRYALEKNAWIAPFRDVLERTEF